MADGWQAVHLGEVVALQRGHDLPAKLRRSGQIPVMGSFGVTGFHDTAKAEGPGVTIGRSGASFGVVNYAPQAYWPLNTVLYVTDFKGNDERFVFYVFKTIDFRRFNSGSAQPSLNRNYLANIAIRLPPLNEQRAIASVLGAFDDKIELNASMNATLEQIMRSRFTQWTHTHSHHFGVLGDVARQSRSLVDPSSAADLPYVALEHMPRKSIALGEWATLREAKTRKTAFERGDILFGRLRPYFHKVGVAPMRGACATTISVIRPIEPHWFSFVLLHVSSDAFVAHADATSTGTTMPQTHWNQLAAYKLRLPPPDVAGRLDESVRPLVERIVGNVHESRTLAELREALLPKLISGELRVRDAAAAVESVGA